MQNAPKSTLKKVKPFRIWDGEGRNKDANGIPFTDGHRLTLLANSDGEYIENADGLLTRDCVLFLTKERPKAIDVWFSFGYDVNKICTGLPLRGHDASLECLWNRGRTWWHGAFFKYLPRKFFTVRYKDGRFHSADTFSFFQTSFLKACDAWGLDASAIIAGKENRGNFDAWALDEIREYNFAELALALDLMNKLRDSFAAVDLAPQSWHGPGAIASTWLRREGMSVHYKDEPLEMRDSIRRAFFGGRIDTALLGEVVANQADLASAYPKGLTDCISMAPLEWEHTAASYPLDRHGLYRIRWERPRDSLWNPFPWRTKNGGVLYPYEGEGWYWGIEAMAAYTTYGADCFQTLEAWLPHGERIYPFAAPIERDYANRAKLKLAKHPSHMAVRLGLNSLYGKLCQHVSGSPNGGRPRWQNYAWAGYTTAYTRACILRAIKAIGEENVIAIATDGIFSRCRLPDAVEPPGPLGSWEDKGRFPTLFIAAGLYAIFKDGEPTTVKQRGMPANINYGWVLRQWGCDTELNCPGVNAFSSTFQSFIGMGKALHQDKPHGEFITEERMMGNIPLIGTSKRLPAPDSLGLDTGWKEYALLPRRRPEPVISYPYKRRQEYDPLEEKE